MGELVIEIDRLSPLLLIGRIRRLT